MSSAGATAPDAQPIPRLRAPSQDGPARRSGTPILFDTATLPPAMRLDAWNAFCEPVIETLAQPCEPPQPAAQPAADHILAARLELWPLGRLALVRMTTTAPWRRTRAQLLADGLDHWAVALPGAGAGRIRAEGRDRRLRSDTPLLWSLADDIEAAPAGSWICLLVPRAAMPGLAPAFGPGAPRRVRGAMGRLLAGMLDRLAAALPAMTSAEVAQAETAIAGLLNACLPAPQTGAGGLRGPIEAARRARVLAIIGQNLGMAELGPEQLCGLASLSRSELYRCFAPLGGVARAIQRERLRHAHAALQRSGGTAEVGRIGEASGFPEPSAFTRAFRREFGYTPSELLARRQRPEGCVVSGLAAALSFR